MNIDEQKLCSKDCKYWELYHDCDDPDILPEDRLKYIPLNCSTYLLGNCHNSMDEITVTLKVSQRLKNAAWYDGKPIDAEYIQKLIDNDLCTMEEYCGFNLNQSEEEFQNNITSFREQQKENRLKSEERWSDPEYRNSCYSMIINDDRSAISRLMESFGKAANESTQKIVENILSGKSIT